MLERKIQDLNIEDVSVVKVTTFDGYEVEFKIVDQTYQFLIGNTKNPFPLNVKHWFNKQDTCHLCRRRTSPAPTGQQVCGYFQVHKEELLSYFLREYKELF